MLPRFNGGAFAPVTPNNGNPNTVYNTSPKHATTPFNRPMADYGGFQTPQIVDSNADTRSPMAITLPTIDVPKPELRRTEFGINPDFWRQRLSESLTGLQPLPIPGIPVRPPSEGDAPVPVPPTTPVPALPQVERFFPQDPLGGGQSGPHWQYEDLRMPVRPEFRETVHMKRAAAEPVFSEPQQQAVTDQNRQLHNELASYRQELQAMGDPAASVSDDELIAQAMVRLENYQRGGAPLSSEEDLRLRRLVDLAAGFGAGNVGFFGRAPMPNIIDRFQGPDR